MRNLQRKRSEEDNEAQGRLKRMCSASQETWRVEDEFSLSIFHPSGVLRFLLWFFSVRFFLSFLRLLAGFLFLFFFFS